MDDLNSESDTERLAKVVLGLKNTHREKAPLNKTQALMESIDIVHVNMDI